MFLPIPYADDFVVLGTGTEEQARDEKEALAAYLERELKLVLSPEKTRITALSEGFLFLGHRVLLKLEHSPAQDPRAGWADTVSAQRRDLEDDLSPTLKRRIQAELPRHYGVARGAAAQSLRRYGEDAAADALPADCPYSLDQITGDWLP